MGIHFGSSLFVGKRPLLASVVIKTLIFGTIYRWMSKIPQDIRANIEGTINGKLFYWK